MHSESKALRASGNLQPYTYTQTQPKTNLKCPYILGSKVTMSTRNLLTFVCSMNCDRRQSLSVYLWLFKFHSIRYFRQYAIPLRNQADGYYT